MSVHYLIDLYANPISSSRIIDARDESSGQTVANGAFIVRVPDNVSVQNPTGFSDLLTKKYQGLLAAYAGFTYLAYDDLTDVLGLNLAYAGTRGVFGDRGIVGINPGGVLRSVVVPLSGPPVPVAVVLWETFRYVDSDLVGERTLRVYDEVPSSPSFITCQVTVDNMTFYPASDGGVTNFLVADQGNSLVIEFTNVASERLYISSWAVIY